jgi:hypothetical protein
MPTQLVNNIENKTNNIMVKLLAKELDIKKFKPLNATVISITIGKPSLILAVKLVDTN